MTDEQYIKCEKVENNESLNSWISFNDKEPDFGDLILVKHPPEQTRSSVVCVYSFLTEWFDGSQYIILEKQYRQKRLNNEQ